MNNRFQLFAVAALVAGATPAIAQGKSRVRDDIPAGHKPPAGMCRIWIDGVPAGQQPAPTDCATAAARRPMNARIIYGTDDQSDRKVRARIPATIDNRDVDYEKDKDKQKDKNKEKDTYKVKNHKRPGDK